ncbi:MAG: cyclic-di-AMP receptor [Oscillospiraceae bacterium]|nr:cyclic-di-AMP receptor [Oscillospiraceae bacterium]
MEQEKSKQKLLLAVIQGDDYPETVDDLNRNGFFATVLSSTGGFLKKRSITLMIGVEEHRMQAALDILRHCAGRRQQMTYSNMSISAGSPNPSIPMIPVQMSVGGAVVFIMDLDDIQKY